MEPAGLLLFSVNLQNCISRKVRRKVPFLGIQQHMFSLQVMQMVMVMDGAPFCIILIIYVLLIIYYTYILCMSSVFAKIFI